MPVIGYFSSESLETARQYFEAFHRGLAETGFIEGRNVAIEYRWAEGQNDRLPALAADLVRRQVAVIATNNTPSTLAAKAATQTIPIVFLVGSDPGLIGLVARLNRPSGNLTGAARLEPIMAKDDNNGGGNGQGQGGGGSGNPGQGGGSDRRWRRCRPHPS
jgi:putative ABC transport system substrate-binding protein